MKASEILNTAAGYVSGDRKATHGDARENFGYTADLWSVWLTSRTGHNVHLRATDVANMMELLKIARRLTGKHNIDDYVDGAGYGALAGQLAGEDAALSHRVDMVECPDCVGHNID